MIPGSTNLHQMSYPCSPTSQVTQCPKSNRAFSVPLTQRMVVCPQTRDLELGCKVSRDPADSRISVIQTVVRSSRPSSLRIREAPTVRIRYGTAGRSEHCTDLCQLIRCFDSRTSNWIKPRLNNVLMTDEMHNSSKQFLFHSFFCLLYMFQRNLVVHHQQHGIIYCITQFGTIGTIVQASLAVSR